MQGQIDRQAQTIFRTLLNGGFECYLVGGSVRDRLLGRRGADLDFTTNARPVEILQLFRRSHYPNKFGTVLVNLNDGQYEITTYRGEGRYSDHRHPDAIAFVDRLEDDLKRRDFTINAMAMDVDGTLVDPFGGRADLDRRLIRSVGDAAERLAEDPLRMLRAVRLATQLYFSIERLTWQAIGSHAGLLAMISQERVRDELVKLIEAEHPLTGIDLLDHLQLLPLILPELASLQRLNSPPDREFNPYQHALQSLRFVRGDGVLRLTALLHVLQEVDEPEAPGNVSTALKRLRFSNADLERATHLIDGLPAIPPDLPATERNVRRLLSVYGSLLPDLLALIGSHRQGLGGPAAAANLSQLQTIERLARELQARQTPLSIADLAVSGSDLMQSLGLPAGPAIGQILRRLLERVLDDPDCNTRAALLQIAAEEALSHER